MPLTYDEKIEMLRLADDLAGGEVSELDTPQTCTVIRALRIAAGHSNCQEAAPASAE